MLLQPVAAGPAGLAPAGAGGIGLATSIAVFALNGYGAAVYFAEDMAGPRRGLAGAVLAALLLTLALEGLPLVAALVGAPDLQALLSAEDPFGLLVAVRGGTALGDAVAVGVVVSIVNAVIAWTAACARFLYSTGRDGSWGRPIDGWLTRVHPRLGSPHFATLLAGAVGVACCFVPLRFLLVLSGTGLLAIYAGLALAALAGRRSGASAHAPYRAPWHPLTPAVTLLAVGYVAVVSWFDLEEGRPALIATGLQIALSLVYWRLALKRRGWEARSPC